MTGIQQFSSMPDTPLRPVFACKRVSYMLKFYKGRGVHRRLKEMKIRDIIQIAAALTLIAVIAAAPGCIFDPKEAVDDDPAPVVEWPDRTNKEDCVTIITRVYNETGVPIEKYKEVLLTPGALQEEEFDAGYIWYNQKDEWNQYSESLTYDEDCRGTEGILENATSLSITIFATYPPDTTGVWDGYWKKIDEIRGVEGNNFWTTTRNYLFDFTFGDDRYHGDFDVIFTIGPDPEDPSKYVIYQAHDMPKGSQ